MACVRAAAVIVVLSGLVGCSSNSSTGTPTDLSASLADLKAADLSPGMDSAIDLAPANDLALEGDLATQCVSWNVMPPTMDFGTIQVDTKSPSAFFLTNTGPMDGFITSLRVVGPNASFFSATLPGPGVQVFVRVGQNVGIPVIYQPHDKGRHSAIVQITVPGTPCQVMVPLDGTAS